jgi:hypothetical protein
VLRTSCITKLPPNICDRVRGNQAFGFEIDFEIRAKNVADGLLQRKCVFHTKVLHDVCGTRLCSLESQNLHAEAARALYTRSCRASPPSARSDYTVKYPRPCADFKPAIWRQTSSCTYRGERTALAFTRLFYLSRWGHDNNGGHHATAEPQRPGRLCLRGSNLRLL